MREFSRIVVAVDSSSATERAIALAISVARGNDAAELIFCHAIGVPRMLARVDRFADDYEVALDVAREGARSVLDRCVALAGEAGIASRSCVRYGKPAGEVAMLAECSAADLIVIGNHHSDKLHRILHGSTRDETVRASSIPVLVAAPYKEEKTSL